MPQPSHHNSAGKTSLHHQAITIKLSADEQLQCIEDLGVMLQTAIERSTSTPWRSVSPTVAVERVEPYRALVVRGDALREVEGWQREVNCECIPEEDKRREITLTLEPSVPLSF